MTSDGRPAPPREILVEAVEGALETPMSRNEATATIAVGAAAIYGLIKTGIQVVRNVLTGEIWNHRETEFVVIEGTGVQERPEDKPYISPWIAFGGLGRPSSVTSAKQTADLLLGEAAAWTPAAGISYSDGGIDLGKIGQFTAKFAEAPADDLPPSINIVGESKGTMEALLAMAALDNPPHIDNFVIVSSPFDLDDVRMKKEVKLIVDNDIRGDVWTEFVYQVALKMGIKLGVIPEKENDRVAGLQQGGQEDKPKGFVDGVKQVLIDAWHDTPRAVSPELYVSGLEIVRHAETALLMQILRQKDAIAERTKFYYLKSSPEAKDETVFVDSADEKYRRCVKDLGAQYESFPYDGDHAQVYNGLGVMKKQFEEDQIARWQADLARATIAKHRRDSAV